ncbi:serine hydrolase domain-containing protein [Novosphingobium colocasiae]|uniref:Beta-lactamase-related domain-containing protein n=1 Tax=Novosphingobium colocasiae TaxID=1256513 RepID=A0A918UFB7_9SPHN|nr:serine hydrolase [Novosphingobium colocasiae]GGZ00138.1 hypothetical protein GCM10011614_13940 [Novosphingobium colocasiae]
MPVRRLSLIAALAMLPALTGCGGSQPDAPPPPSREAEAAIASDGGAPHDALGRAIDALFDADAVGETRALLIMKRGSVIAERYGPGFDAGSRLQGWSMSQCLTALTIGQLVSDGRLRLNETASIPAWQRPGDPRGAIILRQLLQMRSGLRHREDAVPARTSDRFRMLFLDGRDDMAAYAEAQPLAAPAGQAFAISSATGVILADLAARALTDSRDPRVRAALVSEYMRTRILEPVGMTSTVIGFDRAGTMIGSSMMEATARDWARVGELLRHTGSVKGAQILPRRWIQFMLAPSPRNPAYGAGVWLNRPAEKGLPSPLWPGVAPESLFGCLGEQGQAVLGSPDQLLTVVRLGATAPDKAAALHDRLGDLLALFPGYR